MQGWKNQKMLNSRMVFESGGFYRVKLMISMIHGILTEKYFQYFTSQNTYFKVVSKVIFQSVLKEWDGGVHATSQIKNVKKGSAESLHNLTD